VVFSAMLCVEEHTINLYNYSLVQLKE
jgi:hypothetical protein